MRVVTPGPWRIVPDMAHEGNLRIAGGSFSAVAKVYADEPVRGDAKATANARLIAAAPDLLAACQAVVASSMRNEAYDLCVAALSRATDGGEAK